MTVRPLKPKQRGPRCQWCDNRATHRGYGHALGCGDHLVALRQQDEVNSEPDYSDAAFYGGYL